MYLEEQSNLRSPLANEGVVPPYYIHVAFPEYITAGEAAALFSATDILWQVFHSSEQTHTLIEPRIWAPSLNDEELRSYLIQPLPKDYWPFPEKTPEELRVQSFLEPVEGLSANWFKGPCYDIVHVACIVENARSGQLRLDDGIRRWSAGDLAKRLGECKTRLLVLQCVQAEAWESTCEFGRQLGQAGVPAVLALAGKPGTVRNYFIKFYIGIAHNALLSEAARLPVGYENPDLSVFLLMGIDGDELLRLDRWMDSLAERLEFWKRDIEKQQKDWYTLQRRLLNEVRPYIHPAQIEKLAPLDTAERNSIEEVSKALTIQKERIEALPSQPWNHEREGSLIVSGATQALHNIRPGLLKLSDRSLRLAQMSLAGPPSVAAAAIPSQWLDALLDEVQSAPRVLNAGFKGVGENETVGEKEVLIADQEYDLLVDIGPRWDKLRSLVTGSAEFPEKALPPSDTGYLLDMVFMSEEFSPPLVSGRIFLPADSGRSSVWKGEGELPQAGPIALTVRAPEFAAEDNSVIRTARGRLGVYYENNLLQSARVQMSVSRDGSITAEEPNVIDVDYVLSGAFQDVGEQFAKREVRFETDDAWKETGGKGHPVALSITLNDDGSGSHRILMMSQKTGHLDLPELSAWMSYDPDGARDLLRIARSDLAKCFFVKDSETGSVPEDDSKQNGLNEKNGQNREQFEWDLVRLAHRGHKLIESVFSKLYPSKEDATLAAQARKLRKGLLQSRIIQIARTGTASYTLPWALFYDIPLSQDRSQNKFCKSVDEEWSDDGTRMNDHTFCKYANDAWHETNTYCPFAFWGLKHILEQPLSPRQPGMKEEDWRRLLNATRRFGKPGVIPLGLCVTNALAGMELASRDKHLNKVSKLKGFDARLPGAEGLDAAAGEILKSAVVYLLCHGELDDVEKEPYLGIGAKDDDPQHRIYPTTVNGWASQDSWKQWEKQRPLILINGCHTCDLEPGQMLDFVTTFGYAGASGVLGTEVSVRLPLAIEVAESFLELIAQGKPVCESLQKVRWSLANKGNLLGLAYTPYCLSDLSHAAD